MFPLDKDLHGCRQTGSNPGWKPSWPVNFWIARHPPLESRKLADLADVLPLQILPPDLSVDYDLLHETLTPQQDLQPRDYLYACYPKHNIPRFPEIPGFETRTIIHLTSVLSWPHKSQVVSPPGRASLFPECSTPWGENPHWAENVKRSVPSAVLTDHYANDKRSGPFVGGLRPCVGLFLQAR